MDGRYRPKDYSAGSLIVQLKNPKPNWGINFGMYCYVFADGCGISLLGKDGKTLNIMFNKEQISVDGAVAADSLFKYGENINGTISTDGDHINVVINGEHSFTVDKSNFSLATMSINILGSDDGSITQQRIDSLSSLSISNSDN